MATDHDVETVETVAAGIAELVGSRVFEPLHDTPKHQGARDTFRSLAKWALSVAGRDGI